MCDCKKATNGVMNDYYSKSTANTGLGQLAVANSLLNGGGKSTTILVGAKNGTFIKSVRIKATEPVTQGMIRLFIANNIGAPTTLISLFKEIPVPVVPELSNTPMPRPVLPTFEMALSGGFKLQAGYRLIATTQNGQLFNIIAEGLDWEYPVTTPDVCCNFMQETAVTGLGTVGTANTALDGSGAIETVYTSANGSIIKAITIKATQSTSINGMVRLFIDNGVAKFLFKEVVIPESTQSSFEPSYKVVLEENLYLKAGYSIGASTQLDESFALTIEAVNWTYA